MADASRLSTARTRLFDALTAADGVVPWRVHRLPPVPLTAPCVYIDVHRMDPPGSVIAVRLPVVAVWDGADRAQVAALDDVTAAIWDAVYTTGGVPAGSESFRLDTGGPQLRAVQVIAAMTLTGVTLCVPQLMEAV